MIPQSVCLPGFGDTAAYWSQWIEGAAKVPVLEVEWPGLWGASSRNSVASTPPRATLPAPNVVDDVVDQALAILGPGDIVVGHSMGGRLAVEIASRQTPGAVVLLAPTLYQPDFLSPEALSRWQDAGARPTTRPDPITGKARELLLGFEYGSGWLARPMPDYSCLGEVPSVALLFSEDWAHHDEVKGTLYGVATVIEVDGPHRWWEDTGVGAEVSAILSVWLNAAL